MESLCSMIYYSTALLQREWAIELLQLCMPKSCRSLVVSLAYCLGHLGRDRTTIRILDELLARNLHGSEAAVKIMHRMSEGKLRQTVTGTFETTTGIQSSIYTFCYECCRAVPVTIEGNKFALVVMDSATRWPEAFAMRQIESATIAAEVHFLFTRVSVQE